MHCTHVTIAITAPGTLEKGKVFVHGNLAELIDFHNDAALLDSDSDADDGAPSAAAKTMVPVAYFGDHIVSDVIAAKRHTHWHVGAVVEELLLGLPHPTETDDVTASFLRQSVYTWGEFVDIAAARATHVWDGLIRQHSHIAVPHLDALAGADTFTSFNGSGAPTGFH